MLNDKNKRKPLNVRKASCPTNEPEKTLIIPQFKNVHAFIMFVALLSFFSIWGAIDKGFPTMFLISYFAASAVFTNLFKDNLFLNSICAPFAFLSTADSIADILLNTGALWIHLPVAIIIMIIINTRRGYSLSIMLASSLLYSIWLYTIFNNLMGGFVDPMYDMIPPPFDDPVFLAVMSSIGLFATSFGIWFFRSRCSSVIFPWMKTTVY